MRLKLIPAAILSVASFAANGSASLGGYNFDYTVTGDRAVRPVQVFDNGRTVYIQMSATMSAPPAVLEQAEGGARPVRFRYEYPYLVVDEPRAELVLALGGRTAYVKRRDGAEVSGVAAPAAVGGVAADAGAAPRRSSPARNDFQGEIVYRQSRGSSWASPVEGGAKVAQVAPASAARSVETQRRQEVSEPARRVLPSAGVVDDSLGATVHRVAPGESLGLIARRYGVSMTQLIADNGIRNPNRIAVGQAITIRAGRVRTAASPAVAPVAQQTVVASNVALPPAPLARSVSPASVVRPAAAITLPPPSPAASRVVRVAAGEPQPAPARLAAATPANGGQFQLLRLSGLSPRVDAAVLASVRRAIARDADVVLRGYSSALTPDARATQANASARDVRQQLIDRGIPADRVMVVANQGHLMSPSRVDVVLIRPKEKIDA